MNRLELHNALRIGLIGAGRIVERAHLPVLTKMPGVNVVGLYDPDLNRAETMAARYGVPWVCPTIDELLSLGLDATLVACPNHLHAPMSIAALEAGAHVLCEKPMATSIADAVAMKKKAQQVKRQLMVGSANRFRPEIIALHNAVWNGRLGEIRAIRCGWLRRNGIPGVNSWFTRRSQAGGGALTDLGAHLIDLAVSIAGPRHLRSVQCVVDHTSDAQAQASWYLRETTDEDGRCDVEIAASGFAVFDGPLDLFIEVCWASSIPQDRTYLQVIGKSGMAQVETLFGFSPNGHRPPHPLKIWVDGELVSDNVDGTSDLLQPYRDQWGFFLDSIRNGRSIRSSLNEGIRMVQLIDAMYRSAYNLQSVNGGYHSAVTAMRATT